MHHKFNCAKSGFDDVFGVRMRNLLLVVEAERTPRLAFTDNPLAPALGLVDLDVVLPGELAAEEPAEREEAARRHGRC